MKLSIIIPVYNVELYLSKCLDSCVNQKDINKCEYEIIVVNDGSEDSCCSILENYDWQDCKHEVITQSNQGLSIARNNGVLAAHGDYIWFVDSDDWISENSLSVLFPLLDSRVNVICQRAYYKSYTDKELLMEKTGEFNNGPELLRNDYDVMSVLYIFNRKFFLNLGFMLEPNIYHEDTHFIPRAVYLANSICCINTPLYHYLQREGSIMSKHNPKKVYDQIKILNDLYLFGDKYVLDQDRKGWIGHLMSGPILNLLWLAKEIDDKQIKKDVKEFLNSDNRYTKALIYSPVKSIKILGILSAICFGKLYFTYTFLQNLMYKK